MSNLNGRITRLESQQPAPGRTWKDFITGAWEPSPAEWAAFLAASQIVTDADEPIERGARQDQQTRSIKS